MPRCSLTIAGVLALILGTNAQAADSPSAAGYAAGMQEMFQGMMWIDYGGDPDVVFAQSMMLTHQAAIDMANVVLEHGQDPKIRRLAERVIAVQQPEIEMMRAWLADRGHAE